MATQAPLNGSASSATHRPTVLIVEDDPDVSSSIREVVEEQGCRVVMAENGREALSLLEHERVSLMLVDLFMPIMNGVELLKVVKKSPKLASIPRIIMTGANDSMIGVREDVSVLYKPVNFDALTRLLQTYCKPDRPATTVPPVR